jgi:hypothetical protein
MIILHRLENCHRWPEIGIFCLMPQGDMNLPWDKHRFSTLPIAIPNSLVFSQEMVDVPSLHYDLAEEDWEDPANMAQEASFSLGTGNGWGSYQSVSLKYQGFIGVNRGSKGNRPGYLTPYIINLYDYNYHLDHLIFI